MANGDVTQELKSMLEGGKLDSDDALRLLLVMVNQVQLDMMALRQKNTEVLERIAKIEAHNEKYPSLMYLWSNDTRRLLVILIIVFLLYTFIISPWMISDIRHVILEMLGLPHDLGIQGP